MMKRALLIIMCLVALAVLRGDCGDRLKGDTDAVKNETVFANPIVSAGADPWVIRWKEAYYYCFSRSGGIWVSKAAQLEAIGYGDEVCVWAPPHGTEYSEELWAPELHRLDDKWYIYFAADDGDNHSHRMYAIESEADDPIGPYTLPSSERSSQSPIGGP